jgi:hypothetical protein
LVVLSAVDKTSLRFIRRAWLRVGVVLVKVLA